MALMALAEAMGPRGFSGRDEILVLEDLARRHYGGASLPWGNGAILKQLQAWAWSLSGSWVSLHWPVQVALGVQAWALAAIGRRLGGPRVAQGAVLASLLSATALLQARSLLPFAALPALISVALLLSLRGGAWALAGAALLACGFLEYEAVAFALPGFAAFLIFEPRLRGKARLGAALLGFGLALAAILVGCRSYLAEWWTVRQAYNAPLQHWDQINVVGQLRAWAWGGRPESYLGVIGHPFVAWWAQPLIVVGLLKQGQRRPWLVLWIAASLLALLPVGGAFEPHRTVAALPALALAAGFGWRWLWQKSRPWPAATWLLFLLPLAGFTLEELAFERSMALGHERYDRSQGLLAAARDPRFQHHVDAMLMPGGLAIEGLLGPLQGAPQWVWLPGDFGDEAPRWPGVALYDDGHRLTGDTLAQVPARGAEPLLQDLRALRRLWIDLPTQRREMALATRRALQSGVLQTPIARLSVWLRLIQVAVPVDALTLEDLGALRQEKFKSARFYRAATALTQGSDLRITYWLAWMIRKNCGEERLSPTERALLSVPWSQVPVSPTAPRWPEPSPA